MIQAKLIRKNYPKMKQQIVFLFLLVFLGAISFLSTCRNTQAASDAIAIRIMPNPNHYSPLKWYKDQAFTGAPQALLVDGYEAIRDGRTVYVNAANIVDSSGDGKLDKLYTNIYIISYTQEVSSQTLDIFGQILAHWKFNSNFSANEEQGNCFTAPAVVQSDQYCRVDSDCDSGEFCNSLKARTIRDTKRLADLVDLKILINNYKSSVGYYPKLVAGTYLPAISLSVWPSWQSTFSGELSGGTLAVDPINVLGACSGYDTTTCWSEKNKAFGDPTPDNGQFDLPADSHIYIYSGDRNGKTYKMQAVMESGFAPCATEGVCFAGSTVEHASGVVVNNPPTITCSGLVGAQGTNFSGYVKANDADANLISWVSPALNSTFSGSGTGGTAEFMLKSTAVLNQKQIVSTSPIVNSGAYSFNFKIKDSAGAETEQLCTINVSKKKYCGDKIVQNPNDFGEKEECDNGKANGQVCIAGYGSNCTYCSAGCKNVTVSTASFCGDGVVQTDKGEQCDGSLSLTGWNCLGANLSCNSSCERKCSDDSSPYQGSCGDGVCATGVENSTNCLTDCPVTPSPATAVCGDGVCAIGLENSVNCLADCQPSSTPSIPNCTFPLVFPCNLSGGVLASSLMIGQNFGGGKIYYQTGNAVYISASVDEAINQNGVNAMLTCQNSTANGYSDWYVPTLNELALLYANQLAIGGFDETASYWTSDDASSMNYYVVDWNSMQVSPLPVTGSLNNVRCVRKINL